MAYMMSPFSATSFRSACLCIFDSSLTRSKTSRRKCSVVLSSRPIIVTAAAALEEPQTQQIESVEDISKSMDNQKPDSLYQQFDSLLNDTMLDYDLGDRVVGTVATVDEKGAYVDVGSKAPAYIPLQELTNFKVDKVNKVLQPGLEREFQVVYRNRNPRKGRHEIVVSLKEVERDLCWKRIQQYAEEKVSLSANVIGNNSGGLFVNLEGIKGFCPGSHIPQNEKEDGLPALIGRQMSVTVLECDPDIDRLIVSARVKIPHMTSSQTSYKVGDVVLGTVQAVQPYGAFLELGDGMTGLLHISQISYDRVKNIDDVLSVGDKLKVMVLTQDAERGGRLSLSTMKLEPNPGDMLKDPALVFEKADEMAERFRQNIAEAEKSTMAWMNNSEEAAS